MSFIHVRDSDSIVVNVFSNSVTPGAGISEFNETHPVFVPSWADVKWQRTAPNTYINTGNPVTITPDLDAIVGINSADATGDFLDNKLNITAGKITRTIETDSVGVKSMRLNIGADVFDKTVDDADDITDGTTNKFFTDEKVDDRVDALLDAREGLSKEYDDAGNILHLDMDINGLVEDTQPAGAADYAVFFDVSEGVHNKTLISDLVVAGAVIDFYNSSETESSTTSSTYIQKLRLQATLPSTGEYLVMWNMETTTTDGDKLTAYRVQIDDATIVAEAVNHAQNPDEWETVSGIGSFNLNSGIRNFDIDFHQMFGTTAKIRRARLYVRQR